MAGGGIEFDWDDGNIGHLAVHGVTPIEFEQALNNDPLDLDFDVINGEQRYRSVGLTDKGRFLILAWIVRNGRVRAVTAFSATAPSKKAFFERYQ